LEMVFKFCENVKKWLSINERNVAVIHCKAGKGRTGVMICSYLLFGREWPTAKDALQFYAAMRTYNQKGVTIPSQIRYVYYMGQVMSRFSGNQPPNSTVILKSIVLSHAPKGINVADIKFNIYVQKTLIYTYQDSDKTDLPDLSESKSLNPKENFGVTFDTKRLPLCGDIKIFFYNKKEEHKLFHFWFNTSFVENSVILQKSELDSIKDKHHKVFKENFQLELVLQPVQTTVVPKVTEKKNGRCLNAYG